MYSYSIMNCIRLLYYTNIVNVKEMGAAKGNFQKNTCERNTGEMLDMVPTSQYTETYYKGSLTAQFRKQKIIFYPTLQVTKKK